MGVGDVSEVGLGDELEDRVVWENVVIYYDVVVF